MLRKLARVLLVSGLGCALAASAWAQASAPATAEDAAKRRIGFYFGLGLTKLSQQGMANGIGLEVTRPAQPGFPYAVSGGEVDGDFGSRLNLEFMVGFRLREHGNVEATWFQWDEKQDLLTVADDGKAIANTLASPLAGYDEDQNGDGLVRGYNAALRGEVNETSDVAFDAAEDVNYSGSREFIRFDTSDRIVGQLETDYQTFDVDYRRTWKKLRRFELDWRAGIRWATARQDIDLGYRDIDSFAVYIDEEADTQAASGCPRLSARQDGDGDGEGGPNQFDGDGFMNGNCIANTTVDQIESVETVTEDRIIAEIATRGFGVKLGFDGRFNLSKKWRLSGAVAVSIMKTDAEFRYRETFTSERDRFLNFIDWDLNGDGLYNNLDLDFDGSCAGVLEGCRPTDADSLAVEALGFVDDVSMRVGVDNSIASPRLPGQQHPVGMNTNAFYQANFGHLRVGDPVPESERNNDVLREVTVLNDLSGDSSAVKPILDVHVGLQYQFSRLAHLGFGFRASRWFDAGRFRTLANDVVAGRAPEVAGDFTASGAYVTLTIIPR